MFKRIFIKRIAFYTPTTHFTLHKNNLRGNVQKNKTKSLKSREEFS